MINEYCYSKHAFFLEFNTTHKFDAFHFQILIIVVCCQFFSVTVWLNNVQIYAPHILMHEQIWNID